MKSTSYKIQIKASVNGSLVTPKSIAWIHGNDSCLAMPCYKENDYFVIELIPDCVGGNCIEGYLTFGSDCDNCEPVYFKRCFCDSSEDCTQCEECNQYGICQSKCRDGEFCDENGCSECNDTTPCPCNKKCLNGKCVCPQNTFEKDGCCVECDSSTPLTKCEECVNGVIRYKECDGACDPSTGKCVGCLTGGDCSDREDGKTCCKDKICVCCEGTVWDPTSMKCIPQICKSDEECGVCKKCTIDGCKPIECPSGYQCINDECVPACTNVTCNNGADCGENCGCLDGKCVPCIILSCLDEASCQAALGCKCNNNNCEPVNNCGQYCDGSTPCLDTNCTCYNNECVSCENFPCTDEEGGCNSYYNCKCNDESKCEGGKQCDDIFILNKKESCSADGCELEAVYTSKNRCGCDPIEFKVSNTKSCSESPILDPVLLNLSVVMYKRGIEYSKFKTSDKFSDNEIVTGSIKVVTTVGTNSTTITKDISSTNTISNIEVRTPLLTNSKKVKVSVFTQSIKVSSNGCVSYTDKEIATYEFDFSVVASAICSKLESYKTEQVFKLTDNVSEKKPLIVWYRTSSDDFGTSPIAIDSPNYSLKGYFRKKYLSSNVSSFSDKITKPEEGLLNNFRYKVTIDCGCEGSNIATTGDVVIYCCPKDYVILPGDGCGQTLKLQPYTTCSVNGNLNTLKYPQESITKYSVSINGKNPVLLSSFSTINNFIEIKDTEPIKTLEFFQAYGGNAVVKKSCEKTYTFNPTTPDFSVDTSIACTEGEIKVDLTSSSLNLASSNPVIIEKNNLSLKLKPTQNPKIYTTIGSGPSGSSSDELVKAEIKKPGEIKVLVTFSNGCVGVKTLSYTCTPNIDTDAEPDTYARGTCPAGGDNPKIVVTPSGFSDNVVYSLNNGPFQESNEFLNVPAGTYQITAKDNLNGVEVVANSTIVIEPALIPTVTLSPSTLCTGSSSTLTINGAPSTEFKVYGPDNLLITTLTLGSSGTSTLPGLTQAGNYRVVLDSGAQSKSCSPFSQTVTLSVGGQSLTPQIEIQPGNYCLGQPVPFRILDNGINATYNLSSLGTGTITSPLQANQFSYNGEFIPTSKFGYIKITGVEGTCNTTTTPQLLVNVEVSAVITNRTAVCQPNNEHTVTVTTSPDTNYVTIGLVPATNISPNTWQRTNISGLTEVQLFATNGTCGSGEVLQLQNCACPPGSITIDPPSSSTCNQGNATISYTTSNQITPTGSWTYIFQNFAPLLQEWGDVGFSGTFNPLFPPSLSPPTTIGVVDKYRLKLTNPTNGCEYISNEVTVTAVQPPLNVTITPSIPSPALTGQTVTFSTVQNSEYTYTWSGVSGNSSQSNPITFSDPNDYNIGVQVCNGACCTSTSIIYEVDANCANPPAFVQPIPTYTNSCADIQVQHVGLTGSGQITYTVSSTYVNVTSTLLPQNGVIIVPTSAVPAGVTSDFTITLTDNNGCTASTVVPYSRCATGCNCTYNIEIVDPTTGSTSLSTWLVRYEPTRTKLVASVRKLVTKQCSDLPLTTISNQVQDDNLLELDRFVLSTVSGPNPITSMDVISSGTPITLAIPTLFNGGNPQTDANKLVEFLNANVVGTVFSTAGNVIRHNILQTNTGGFNVNGTYTKGGNQHYQVVSGGRVYNNHSATTPCGDIRHTKNYDPMPDLGELVTDLINYNATYNSLVYLGSTTSVPTINRPGHSPTKICSGCN